MGRFHDSAGGSHRTCGNVYVEEGVFAIQRGVCTERVGTYAYRGAFPHLAGRVARNVSERIVFIYCHEQDIVIQQAVFPAAQCSTKNSSARAMDDYVKVLYFTRVEKCFLTYASCISLPRPMVILLNWYYLWHMLNVSVVFYTL